jgi:arsenical pump membrane protein
VTILGWAIAACAIVAVLVRPFRINEAWWALAGALGLVLVGAITPPAALAALGRGVDVELFLIGMMVLAEYARIAGLLAWVAARAVDLAGGSRIALLALVYGAGIVTTALLSNDATIVVLTPAVIDALRRLDAPPFLYVVACALVANAASFVLPISNPSNLLVFAGGMPALGGWLATFGLPSLAALAVTFAVLALWFRRDLRGTHTTPNDDVAVPRPTTLGMIVLIAAAAVIVVTSAREGPLGLATFACAVAACIIAAVQRRADAIAIVRGIAWPVLVLTASLFVIVAAVDAGGGFDATRRALAWCAAFAAPWGNVAVGFAVALASNIVNNLPVGLNLGQTLPTMHAAPTLAHAAPSIAYAAPALAHAALIGVNLGPNATVNGSLATLLWLTIVRRANIPVSPLRFAAIGITATVPALLAALLLVR